MPLTLLPPLNLSSAHEFVKFEITCTSLPVQPRPALLSHDSSVSSHSASTESSVSSCSRKSRPSLSPEALLTHAFGPAAYNRLTPSLESIPKTRKEARPSTSSLSSSNPSSPYTASRAPSRSSKGTRAGKDGHYPQPPPRGTFRSAPMSTSLIRLSEGKLPLSEMMPFNPSSSESQYQSKGITSCCECERNSKREPPMSPEIWREKVEERRERRKLLRLRTPKDEPLGIDCRSMEDSGRAPPLISNSMEGKPVSNNQIYSSPILSDFINDVSEEREMGSLIEKDKTLLVLGNMSPGRNSTVEVQEVRNSIKQFNTMRPENSQN